MYVFCRTKKSIYIKKNGIRVEAQLIEQKKKLNRDGKILYYDPNSFKKHICKDDSYIYVDYTWEDGNPFEWTHDGFLFLVEISFLTRCA